MKQCMCFGHDRKSVPLSDLVVPSHDGFDAKAMRKLLALQRQRSRAQNVKVTPMNFGQAR
jgi:hypothetical protein